MTDPIEVLSGELVPAASELVLPGGGAAAAPLLPAAERYAASQAAPSTRRTYRSTLRCFALFVETELGLPAAVGRVALDTVLDYSAWLQDLDEDTDEPRCHPRTVAKQLSAIRGFARWLSLAGLPVDPRIQQIRVKAGPPPAPRALTPTGAELLVAQTGWTLHQFRHSALTHLAEDNVQLPLLMAKSRHRSLRTLQRYARPGPDAVAALTASLDPACRR